MGRKKNKSPAQAARTALVERYGLKNNKNANYWFVRCPRTGADWLFDSDLRIEHYYACESDPTVVNADYSFRKLAVQIDGVEYDARIDARVELTGGEVELRRVQTLTEQARETNDQQEAAIAAAVTATGARYRLTTVDELDRISQRVRNWRRGYRFLRAARLLTFVTTESNVRLRLEQRRDVTLEQLIASLPNEDGPLVVAAVMSLHRKRLITSDLDINPLGTSTRLKWLGDAP